MPSVIVIARHYHPSPGAASNRLSALVGPLTEAGWEVTVVTRRLPEVTGLGPHEYGPHGERILRVTGDRETGAGLRRVFALLTFPLNVLRALRRADVAADVIVADPPPTVGLAMLAYAWTHRAPAVYYLADRWQELLRASESRIARALALPVGSIEKYVLAHSAVVITVTEGFANAARQCTSRVSLIRNGVDGSIFDLTGEVLGSERLGLPPGVPYFLYAGNFGEAHGASIFVEAAHALWAAGDRGFGLVFMGYGSGGGLIDEIARAYPQLCQRLPPQPPEFAAAAFRGAIAGLASVKPSPHLEHAVSVKALASIMCGAPVLYAGGGPFAEEVEQQNFGVASEYDPTAVSKAMEVLTRTPWSREERRALANRASDRYDNRRHATELVRLLSSLNVRVS